MWGIRVLIFLPGPESRAHSLKVNVLIIDKLQRSLDLIISQGQYRCERADSVR